MSMISIVMPVYNGERFLEQSIDSIIAQSYKDWELILVNDCSTDNSYKIMQNYAKSDDRIKIICNEENLKLPMSLNAGFAAATGRYYTWTSDDNIFYDNALEELYNFLSSNKDVGMVYSDMEYIDENAETTGYQKVNPEEIFFRNCVGACFMYSADVASEIGDYNPECFLVEDYDYWLRINRKYPIRRIDKVLYRYRRHSASLTETRQMMIREQLYKLRMQEYPYFGEQFTGKIKEKLFLQMYFENIDKRGEILEKFWAKDSIPQCQTWIARERAFDDVKKIILFGAGNYGRKALAFFGADRIAFFSDNNINLEGKNINGKQVISYEKLRDMQENYQIVICVSDILIPDIVRQFEKDGIIKYNTYSECVTER